MLVDEFDLNHPAIAPIITRTIVLSFINGGRFVASMDLGIDHSIADPVVIDSNAIMIIGLITFISSFDDECGLCRRGPQMVTIENRIE